uniref:Uncharacterized protein n=1 Tax=Arundo donax TaxID=35708 RepID=A0A0A9H2J6_ARUDO
MTTACRCSSVARGSAAPLRGRARRCTSSGKARRCTPSATSAATRSSWSGTRTYTTPTTSSRGSSSRSGLPRTPSFWRHGGASCAEDEMNNRTRTQRVLCCLLLCSLRS